jgi:hypothetical protein
MHWTEIESIFFEAMRRGYAGGSAEETALLGLPGYKAIIYECGSLKVIDYYCKSEPPDANSMGSTVIIYDGKPLWCMNYGGFYRELAIPFLKKALLKNYERDEFLGGRGPEKFEEGRMVYSNKSKGNFLRFEGAEEIILKPDAGQPGHSIGWHKFFGFLL